MKKFISTIVFLGFNLIVLCCVIYLIPKVTERSYQITKDFVMGNSNNEKVSKEIKISIVGGASTKDIAKLLKEKELISSPEIFILKAKLGNYDGSFKKGDYSLNTSMSEAEIMEILKAGAKAQNDIVFTIPEGYTTAKIANKLEKENIIKSKEFIEAINNEKYDYDFLAGVPNRDVKFEGYLFPDTYYFRENITPEEIVSKLLSRFGEVYNDDYINYGRQKGVTMDYIITVASIIEKEAKLDSERARIAGVIYNRLDEGMPLQMDSTVNYAFELKNGLDSDRDERKVTLKDLKIKSPYNTYENVGIPIGPICNPGKSSIEAALFPEHNDYLYFVLKDAETGEHVFTKTLEEHNIEKAKYKDINN